MHKFSNVLATTPLGTPVKSNCFYNSEGYSFGINVYPSGKDSAYPDYVGMTFFLCSGENDAVMEWPAKNRQATIVAMDQDPDVRLRMSSTRSFTTDTDPRWNKPTATSGQEFGWSTFISIQHLQRRSFLKNDDLIITADFNDLTHLIKTEVPVKPAAPRNEIPEEKPVSELKMKPETPKHREARAANPCGPNHCINGGMCVESKGEASCRCASSQTTYYTGKRCEKTNIDRGILGALIGGAAGTVVLTLAIFTVIRRAQ
ncbi:meprin A subunit alpha-like [Notothenia coriiceps]|uniref:Meprin A subunit alpha-like n=1 Tax=Notothenia coriiceps TaxID=8208 RepID=A0A6I9Q0E2_9TELE|nr:PREDICTED: meprin A subunit alpha-like [Notothenia coriiceps]